MEPARTLAVSLTFRPGIREQHRSEAVLLIQLYRLKSVSALPPIPGMMAMDRRTYASCQDRTHAPRPTARSHVSDEDYRSEAMSQSRSHGFPQG